MSVRHEEALARIREELAGRERGDEPDDRFDPILDSLLDLLDDLGV